MIVYSQTQLVAMLAALVAEDGPFDTAVIRLFQNDLLPTPSTVVGDLTEATYTGYAASAAVEWGDPHLAAGDIAQCYGDIKEIPSTGTAVVNTIYGWYLTTGASPGVLHGIGRFDSPVQVTNALDTVVVFPLLQLANPS